MSKFKVGDRVRHEIYGNGTIRFINSERAMGNAVEFDKANSELHNLGGAVRDNTGYWCFEIELEPMKEKPKNLIPLIAKELGVEIGEEFDIVDSNGRLVLANAYLTTERSSFGGERYKEIFLGLLDGTYKIKKLPKKPILTEDEKVILRNLSKDYKWIAKDMYRRYVSVYTTKPTKSTSAWQIVFGSYDILSAFNHLFQFIKWQDSEPYNIKELLEGVK